VGGALGLAVLATVAATQTAQLLVDGQSVASALTGGFRMVFGISAGLLVAGILLSATVLQPMTKGRVLDREPDEAPAEDAA
jgi:hypothetical protein